MTQPSLPVFSPLALALTQVALIAGDIILQIRHRVGAATKKDGSPVTEADLAAEAVIHDGLARHAPDVPVIAEEAASAGAIPDLAERFFLVDPLDGTREFIAGRDEFTVNIALVDHGMPVFGVIFAPALGDLYVGEGKVAAHARTVAGAPVESLRWTSIRCRKPGAMLSALASRSHSEAATEEFLASQPIHERLDIGSSLKFCLVASGKADLYPRFSRTMEWDVAAGHALLIAAGGSMTKPDGSAFRYGKTEEGYANGPFLARGWRG